MVHAMKKKKNKFFETRVCNAHFSYVMVDTGKIEVARLAYVTRFRKVCRSKSISFHKTHRVTQRIPRKAFAYRSPVSAKQIFKGVTGKQLGQYYRHPFGPSDLSLT